jgi:hypothetical protein
VTYVDVESWRDELDGLLDLVGQHFGRLEPRERARRYVDGLVAGLERKNGWTLAEHAGEVSPDGMQRLLRRADWDIDGSATASAGTWWTDWGTPVRCWSPMTPGS